MTYRYWITWYADLKNEVRLGRASHEYPEPLKFDDYHLLADYIKSSAGLPANATLIILSIIPFKSDGTL